MADHNVLLRLPLELREQVYRELFRSPTQGPDILQTCREIYGEAYKFLFLRTIRMRSQEHLYRWLKCVPQENLRQATDIHIDIQDIDLHGLLQHDLSADDLSHSARLLTWDIYKADLEEMVVALSKISSTTSLTIRALPETQSFLYRKYLAELLNILSCSFPSLRNLCLEGNMHHQTLSFLRSLPKLRALTLDGFSASSVKETISIMQGLKHLESLSLVTEQTMLTPTSYTHSSFTDQKRSITGDVVRSIRKLASFSVEECTSANSPTLSLASEMIDNLHHLQNLATFSIRLSSAPDEGTLRSLHDFLGRSKVKQLDFDWPEITCEQLESYSLLPESIRTLWLRVQSVADAADILCSIWERRRDGDMISLRTVVLVRAAESLAEYIPRNSENLQKVTNCYSVISSQAVSSPEDSDAMNSVWLADKLRELGVRILWCTD